MLRRRLPCVSRKNFLNGVRGVSSWRVVCLIPGTCTRRIFHFPGTLWFVFGRISLGLLVFVRNIARSDGHRLGLFGLSFPEK